MLSKVVVISLLSLLIYETYYYFISREDRVHWTACLTSQKGFTQISQGLSPKSLAVYPITYYKEATYYLIISKRE